MFKTILTIILTGMFFVLFFEPYLNFNLSKNKVNEKVKVKVSSSKGFVEDTEDVGIMPIYPFQMMTRDEMGKLKIKQGDIGTFEPNNPVPENNWLNGFPI